jgi:hypothetical protein
VKTLLDDACRRELIDRLGLLRPDSARRWGRMSVHQMVCHLGDACRMMMGEQHVSVASGAMQRTLVKWIALYAPVPWPPDIVTRPEIDQVLGAGTKPMDFATDVAALQSMLAAIKPRGNSPSWPDHPIFGPMSERAWFRWAYLHTDHHLRQFGV